MCPKKPGEPFPRLPASLYCTPHPGKKTLTLFKNHRVFAYCECHVWFILHSANNFAMKAKRKTLNAGDVLAAMEEMEFERFLVPLKEALEGLFRNISYYSMILAKGRRK